MGEAPLLPWPAGQKRAGSETCEILIEGLEVMADIGAMASERGVPQPLRLHLALEVVPPLHDDLAHTLDYVAVRDHAVRLAGERIVLIETFARRLAATCLTCDGVLAVEVRVEKPRALPGCIAGARVRLDRHPPASDRARGGDASARNG